MVWIVSKAMIDLSIDIMKAAPGLYGLDDQQMVRMAEISTRSIQGVRGMSWMFGPGQPGERGFEALHVAGGVLQYGIPSFRLPEAVLNEEVDRILDMARTTVNVTGDAMVSVLIGKSEGELDEEIYNTDTYPTGAVPNLQHGGNRVDE